MIRLTTTLGVIDIELNEKAAPITVANFRRYVAEGYYSGTVFHRVIKGFMIQGGGMTADLKNKEGQHEPIKNESANGLANDKYTIAMARTSVPDSATSQFFINTQDNTFLNRDECQDGVGYAVFGKVVAGFDVVDKIEAVPTGTHGWFMRDVPRQTVEITKAEEI